MRMNIGYLLIRLELEQMSRYLDLVETSLQQHFKKLETSYQEDMAQEMTEDEAAIWDDHYTDDFIEAGQDFPQLLLLSFIVTWYSFVEQRLIDLCEELKLSISVNPKNNESFGKGIWRARRFLLEARKYSIDAIHWQELTRIGRLRNAIVHDGRRLPWSYYKSDGQSMPHSLDDGTTVYIHIEKDLFHYLQKHNMIEYSGPFFDIVPSFDYCNSLVKFGKELFSKLYNDLKPSRA